MHLRIGEILSRHARHVRLNRPRRHVPPGWCRFASV